MEDITLTNDENFGGLRKLSFTPARFLSSLSPLTFKTGRDWITIGCVPETGVLTEQTDEDENGTFQNVEVNCTVPKIRGEVHATLQVYRGEVCVVRCDDQNGNQRLVGMSAGQVRLYDQSTSGAALADLNSYKISFRGRQLETAPFA